MFTTRISFIGAPPRSRPPACASRNFPQTEANLTAAGQTLFELIKGRRLRLYADGELRQQAMNTVAIESPRGFRIAKANASRKVDAIVALARACRAAVDQPQRGGVMAGRLTWGNRRVEQRISTAQAPPPHLVNDPSFVEWIAGETFINEGALAPWRRPGVGRYAFGAILESQGRYRGVDGGSDV